MRFKDLLRRVVEFRRLCSSGQTRTLIGSDSFNNSFYSVSEDGVEVKREVEYSQGYGNYIEPNWNDWLRKHRPDPPKNEKPLSQECKDEIRSKYESWVNERDNRRRHSNAKDHSNQRNS